MAQLLYRTNISLTGNAKLGVWLGRNRSVDHCALAPVSSNLSIVPERVNIYNSTLGYDLSQYYKRHQDIFYSPQIPQELLRDEPYKAFIDSDYTIDPFFTDGQYGLKRVSHSKNGKQLSLFAPVFIRNASDIPSAVTFIIQTGVGVDKNGVKIQPKFIKKTTININGTPLWDYLQRSYKGLNGYNKDGSDIEDMHIMNINPQSTYSLTRGWSMESGGVCDVQSDLMNKLFTNALTFQEFSSYICDEYRNFKMTCPWILNLCWYFDVEDIMPIVDIPYGQTLKIDVDYIDDKGNAIPRADLDMNFRLISPGTVDKMFDNTLDACGDWSTKEICSDVAGHLAPITNTWSLSGSYNNYVFNVYPGFDNPDIKWNSPYFQDSYDPNDNTSSNTISWMYSLPSKTNARSMNINDIIYGMTGSIQSMYYGDEFIDYQDFKNTIICNGVKYSIDYNVVLKDLKSALAGIPVDENPFITDSTKWSISKVYNNVTLGGNPKWFVICNVTDKKITSVNIILWLPKPNMDLNEFVLKKFKDNEWEPADTHFIIETSEILPWNISEPVSGWNPGRWLTYIEPSIISIQTELQHYNTTETYESVLYNEDDVMSAYKQTMTGMYRVKTQTDMQRYFGWIQPRTILLSPLARGENAYERSFVTGSKTDSTWCVVCTKNIDANHRWYTGVNSNTDERLGRFSGWGNGCGCELLSIPDDDGIMSLQPFLNIGLHAEDYYVMSRVVGDDVYSRYGSLEWKCFDWSQALFIPDTITVTLDIATTDKELTIGGLLKRELLKRCRFEKSTAYMKYFILRITSLYYTEIDTDIDKNIRTVTFKLK